MIPSSSFARNTVRNSYRLSTRIVAASLLALLAVVAMIGNTLWLTWRLEGAGGAINDTGSLRMQANSIGVELLRTIQSAEWSSGGGVGEIHRQADAMTATLQALEEGDARRPLMLPDDPAIHVQLRDVRRYWEQVARRELEQALQTGDANGYLQSLPQLVHRANMLVAMIERDNVSKTTALRLTQGVMLMLAVLGTLVMIYLLYLWIIAPVLQLRDGLQSMAARQFGTRLAVRSRDEFGALAQGFNQMADELQNLYTGLEERVAEKTRELEAQNRQISALYEMAAFLNQTIGVEAIYHGFMQRVMKLFDAQGASIRGLDADGERISLLASIGLSGELTGAEHCMPVDDCHCGRATQQQEMIFVRDIAQKNSAGASIDAVGCQREGFASVAVFRIVSQNKVLGSFSLHFRARRELLGAERQLLQSHGQLLGVAMENRALEAKARELAVVQERGLVAQGLHDSLAQGLNFLNMQLQMLEDAIDRKDAQEVDEIVPLLRTGVDESYQDVRELLTNFRTKLGKGDFGAVIEETLQRFHRQTGVQPVQDIQYKTGAPLTPEQQLQVLFILQEALSNVRKHAQAQNVFVRIANQRDFVLEVRDDGLGYDSDEVAGRGEAHVGLYIMRERAARMNALLEIDAREGQGVSLRLTLPAAER